MEPQLKSKSGLVSVDCSGTRTIIKRVKISGCNILMNVDKDCINNLCDLYLKRSDNKNEL